MRFGAFALAAATVIDWLSLLLPLGLGQDAINTWTERTCPGA